jgi:hypothetical protein
MEKNERRKRRLEEEKEEELRGSASQYGESVTMEMAEERNRKRRRNKKAIERKLVGQIQRRIHDGSEKEASQNSNISQNIGEKRDRLPHD